MLEGIEGRVVPYQKSLGVVPFFPNTLAIIEDTGTRAAVTARKSAP